VVTFASEALTPEATTCVTVWTPAAVIAVVSAVAAAAFRIARAVRMLRRREDGFSLVELLIAMGITLLVIGAIFSLMLAFDSAIQREPAKTERQQNARAAVVVLQQDLLAAGTDLGVFTQTFTPGLNGGGPYGSDNPDRLEFMLSPIEKVSYYLADDEGASGLWRSGQVVARGIEDFQVQYRNGGPLWLDDPGVVACAEGCAAPTTADYNTAIREVRVTVTASGGQVTTVVAIQALLLELSKLPSTSACPDCPLWSAAL
jgi:type II secretory pathway pseudopilin PulG